MSGAVPLVVPVGVLNMVEGARGHAEQLGGDRAVRVGLRGQRRPELDGEAGLRARVGAAVSGRGVGSVVGRRALWHEGQAVAVVVRVKQRGHLSCAVLSGAVLSGPS